MKSPSRYLAESLGCPTICLPTTVFLVVILSMMFPPHSCSIAIGRQGNVEIQSESPADKEAHIDIFRPGKRGQSAAVPIFRVIRASSLPAGTLFLSPSMLRSFAIRTSYPVQLTPADSMYYDNMESTNPGVEAAAYYYQE